MGLGVPEMMAIGGGLGLLSGGLKGGLQGAALGGLGGYGLDKLKGASFLQSAAAAPVATPATASAFETSMGLPQSGFYAAGGTGMTGANTLGSMGMVPTAGGTMINPEYYTNILGNPIYKGGEGLLSNAYSNVKEYLTPQNLMGVANVLSSSQAPQSTPAPSPSSSMRQGSTQGLTVNYGMAKPIKRRGMA